MFAPVLPTITEELWSRRGATPNGPTKSINTSPWPTASELTVIEAPEHSSAFAAARAIIGEVRRVKGSAKLSLRWPVDSLRARAGSAEVAAAQAVLDDIRAAGVIRDIAFESGGEGWVFDVRLAGSDTARRTS